MQSYEENIAFDLRSRRNGRHHADHDPLADTRDRTIAELKSQVTLLRRELSRRDDVLMFLAGMVGPHLEDTSEMPEEPSKAPPERPRMSAPGRTRDGARKTGARGETEKPEWPPLPEGYRVVAYASDAWVLVARGERVAGYRGILDREETAQDAWEHHRRNT